MTELQPDYFDRPLADVDPEVAEAIQGELRRQQNTLEMIASENFVPQAVLECQGSVLTNKYAEGYPGKRYYGGCEFVDVAESLAISRVKALFGADLVIDGGELAGTPSTVIDLRAYEATGGWRIVRQGAVPEAVIRSVA